MFSRYDDDYLSVKSTFYLLSASQTSFLSVLKDAPYYLNGEVMGREIPKNLDVSRVFKTFRKRSNLPISQFESFFHNSVQVFESAIIPFPRGAYYLLTACQFLFKSKKDELLHPSSYADYLSCNDSIAIRMPSLNAYVNIAHSARLMYSLQQS